MAAGRDIKRRLASVRSTQQITRAMKLVSSSKLRATRGVWQNIKPYSEGLERLLSRLAPSVSHPWLQGGKAEGAVLYVAIGSDRGLAGSFNVNLHRFVQQTLQQEARPWLLWVSGLRLADFCRSRSIPVARQLSKVRDVPSFALAQELADELADGFDRGQYCEVRFIFTAFRNSLVQEPALRTLLPLPQMTAEEAATAEKAAAATETAAEEDFIFEPSRQRVLEHLLPLYVRSKAYALLTESKASEHASRMTAMSAASDNASEMIDRLTLSLNRSRQAAITTEISEIVGGAAALGS